MGRWMFSALPFAGSAAILLFSIRGSTIADDIFASAVRALHGDRDHQTFYFFQDFCFYSITAFSFCPLPERFIAYMNRFMPLWQFYREELNRAPLGHESWEY
jgi:hypothetical protein